MPKELKDIHLVPFGKRRRFYLRQHHAETKKYALARIANRDGRYEAMVQACLMPAIEAMDAVLREIVSSPGFTPQTNPDYSETTLTYEQAYSRYGSYVGAEYKYRHKFWTWANTTGIVNEDYTGTGGKIQMSLMTRHGWSRKWASSFPHSWRYMPADARIAFLTTFGKMMKIHMPDVTKVRLDVRREATVDI